MLIYMKIKTKKKTKNVRISWRILIEVSYASFFFYHEFLFELCMKINTGFHCFLSYGLIIAHYAYGLEFYNFTTRMSHMNLSVAALSL